MSIVNSNLKGPEETNFISKPAAEGGMVTRCSETSSLDAGIVDLFGVKVGEWSIMIDLRTPPLLLIPFIIVLIPYGNTTVHM